jgi:hypothetical protein
VVALIPHRRILRCLPARLCVCLLLQVRVNALLIIVSILIEL